jgi:hypothetical protein
LKIRSGLGRTAAAAPRPAHVPEKPAPARAGWRFPPDHAQIKRMERITV